MSIHFNETDVTLWMFPKHIYIKVLFLMHFSHYLSFQSKIGKKMNFKCAQLDYTTQFLKKSALNCFKICVPPLENILHRKIKLHSSRF